jgi:hypothetical protein
MAITFEQILKFYDLH